jgi:hypothetical protein
VKRLVPARIAAAVRFLLRPTSAAYRFGPTETNAHERREGTKKAAETTVVLRREGRKRLVRARVPPGLEGVEQLYGKAGASARDATSASASTTMRPVRSNSGRARGPCEAGRTAASRAGGKQGSGIRTRGPRWRQHRCARFRSCSARRGRRGANEMRLFVTRGIRTRRVSAGQRVVVRAPDAWRTRNRGCRRNARIPGSLNRRCERPLAHGRCLHCCLVRRLIANHLEPHPLYCRSITSNIVLELHITPALACSLATPVVSSS